MNSDANTANRTATSPLRAAEPGTIAICFVSAALQSVRERGLNVEDLLAAVGLSASLLHVPQARISAKLYAALWRSIAVALDDEFFGQDSRRMKAGSFAMLCHAVLGCETLGQALDRSLRYYALILDDIHGSAQRGPEEARIVLHERVAAAGRRVFAHELLLMLIYGMSCWLVGRRIPILRTEFSYPEPAHSAEYRLMYCSNLLFDQSNTLLAFSPGYLDLPVVQNERSAREFLRSAPENILLKYKNGSSLAAKVRRRLRQSLPGVVPDFDQLARHMNMTPATMRRRLQEEGESYQSIKDQLRRDLAIGYLSDTSRSVMNIASELGFSERSAFHRAFRKWTGASPAQFRRTLGAANRR